MPAVLCHYLLAERLWQRLKDSLQPAERGAFLWGAQGPDFLYDHRAMPWQKGESLKAYGDAIHRLPLDQLLDEMRRSDADAHGGSMHAYLLGFLCHFALDDVARPFISYSTQALGELVEWGTEQTCRCQVESMLDVVILRYERAALPTEINLKTAAPDDAAAVDAMCRLYPRIFRLLQKDVDAPLIRQCCKDYRSALGRLTDRTSLKKQLVVHREKKKKLPPVWSCRLRGMTEDDGFDYANSLHLEWQWPMDAGKVRTDSFFDLFDQAEILSLRWIEAYCAGEPIAALNL